MLEITELHASCSHNKAIWYNQTKDEFEGRVYDLVYCPECKSFWEERSRLGKHVYPKGKIRGLTL